MAHPASGASAGSVRPALAKTLFIGLFAGFASGLLGVGGGILVVPGLVMLLRSGQQTAHATSAAAIAPIAVVGAATFASQSQVDWPLAAVLAAGAVAGAPLGVRLSLRIPERGLRYVFAGVCLVTGVRMAL